MVARERAQNAHTSVTKMSAARRADRRVGRPRPGDQGRARVVLGRTFWDSLGGPDECRGRPPERGTFMGERTGVPWRGAPGADPLLHWSECVHCECARVAAAVRR